MSEEAVHHPDHYQGKIECIDIIDAMTDGVEGAEAFALGSAIKYLFRYRMKGNAVQDLKKSKEYIDMIIERRNENET